MIKLENVTKSYGDGTVALDNVSFEVEDRDFVFIVGPSGAGKTTLVKLLIKEETPTQGTVKIDEDEVRNVSKDELFKLRRKIGVVFQDFKLLESKTVFENVAVSLEVVDRPESEINQVVPNVLNLVGLTDKANSFPKELSGGEKQRVAIARALAHEPKYLIADEPTGNIDPRSSEELALLLNNINLLGTTVIMCTHDASIVNKLKKRVIRFEKGRLIKDEKVGKYES